MIFQDNSSEDQISEFNPYLNEMTMIYWLGKNYDKIGNPDFIGTAQYRRYLQFNETDLKENIILCVVCSPVLRKTLFNNYCTYHNKDDLLLFVYNLLAVFPQFKTPLQNYLNQCLMFKCNMFVMSKQNFFEYYNFIEKCIKLAIKILPKLNLDQRDTYQKRALGFILERMTGFWLYFKNLTDKNTIIKSVKMIEINLDSPYKREIK